MSHCAGGDFCRFGGDLGRDLPRWGCEGALAGAREGLTLTETLDDGVRGGAFEGLGGGALDGGADLEEARRRLPPSSSSGDLVLLETGTITASSSENSCCSGSLGTIFFNIFARVLALCLALKRLNRSTASSAGICLFITAMAKLPQVRWYFRGILFLVFAAMTFGIAMVTSAKPASRML